MLNQPYKLFRFITFLCLAAIIGISIAYYFSFIADKLFAILSGVVAILAGIFGLFSTKPFDKQDVSVAVDKVLTTYEKDTLQGLKEAKDEEQKIKDFIENRSNEIFLLKLRSYLVQDIEEKYKGSEVSKLIGELESVEAKLDEFNMKYNSVELPDRFKKLLNELNRKNQIDLALDMIDAIPFFPFKKMFKASAKLYYMQQTQRIWK